MAIDQATLDFLAKNYGSEAAWYTNPEIGPVLVAALTAGKNKTALTGARFQDFIRTHAVDATGKVVQVAADQSWFGKNSASVRTKMAEENNDPATFKDNVKRLYDETASLAQSKGVKLDEASLQKIAKDSYINGWTSTQLDNALVAQYHYDTKAPTSGTAGKALSDFQSIARKYGVVLPNDPTQMENFIKGAIGQNGTEEDFTNYAKEQAKIAFPWMNKAIDAGVTPQGYLAPYATVVSNTLGIPSDAIDWSQPKWQSLVKKGDPNHPELWTPATTDDVMKKIKTDPQYGFDYTPEGRKTGADFAAQLKQMFGY